MSNGGEDSIKTSSSGPHNWHNNMKRSTMMRERKASITLGIIMSAFTICWLPFFILALLEPLIKYDPGPAIKSFTLWLGYSNSMLNPVIYVTFHQDFRRAFRELLRCHWSTLNSRLRDDYYLRTYTLEVPNPPHILSEFNSNKKSPTGACGGILGGGGVGCLRPARSPK